MDKKKTQSDAAFVKKVLRISFVLLMYAAALALIAWMHLDGVKALCSDCLAVFGAYESALELSESIENESAGQNARYALAGRMHENGEYLQAAELYRELGDFSDAGDKRLESLYSNAQMLYAEGKYNEARDSFASLGSYADAPRMQLACAYAMAEISLQAGEYLKAVTGFTALGDYADAPQRAYKAAFALGGDEETARMIINSGGLSPESVEKAARLANIRSELPLGTLAAGNYHSLFLREDGSVAACGDNSYGQCDVAQWRDISQICAGAEHSVGLRADGTVVALGSNEYGQCDVTGWKNVVSIAVGDYDTLALCADGTVLSCGYHDYEKLRQADSIAALFAGAYGAAAISDSGYMLSSHDSILAEDAQLILELEIGNGCNAVLYADGSCHMDFLPGVIWEDIAQIELSPRAMLAVNTRGSVSAYFFRDGDFVDFRELSDVQLCAAGTEHYLFLTADGKLHAYGDNSHGQCDVEKLMK